MPTVDDLAAKLAAAKDAEEWGPPPLPPLPDTTGWTVAQLEALALDRCIAAGDTQLRDRANAGRPMACKRHQLEALHGRDPYAGEAPIDVDALYKLTPPPDKGWSQLHDRLLRICADRVPRDLEEIAALAATGTTSENVSARIRDCRKAGYPMRRKMIDGRARYWLGA